MLCADRFLALNIAFIFLVYAMAFLWTRESNGGVVRLRDFLRLDADRLDMETDDSSGLYSDTEKSDEDILV